jgi:hypothetical protein
MSWARPLLFAVAWGAAWLLGAAAGRAQPGPVPPFRLGGVVLESSNLRFAPRGGLERPALIKMEGRLANPLGRYYLYYSAHNHSGIGLATADSLEGPWIEVAGTPLIRDVAIPDVLWIKESGRLHLWAHGSNSHTDLWTSHDGINFQRHSTSIRAATINTRNATYSRAYDYPLERFSSRYIMLYSGLIEERGVRAIWLAISNDAETWTQLSTPLVEPAEHETTAIYDPALLRLDDRTFIVYNDASGHRGGSIRYVEIDRELNPLGSGGERFVLKDPGPGPPLNGRFRSAQIHQHDNTLLLLSGASFRPGIIIYATAHLTPPAE